MNGVIGSMLMKLAGKIIFVKIKQTLSFSFMKTLSCPTALPLNAFWSF